MIYLRVAPSLLHPFMQGSSSATAIIKAGLLTFGSPYSPNLPILIHLRTVALRGFRPRSQRRDHDGFSPSSLLNQNGTFMLKLILH